MSADTPGFFYDPAERAAAAAIERDHRPNWVVMWGAHSRLLWAFPLFSAPPGTVLSAPVPAELVAAMRQAELAARRSPRQYRPSPPA
jgi:hypothetical protein